METFFDITQTVLGLLFLIGGFVLLLMALLDDFKGPPSLPVVGVAVLLMAGGLWLWL